MIHHLKLNTHFKSSSPFFIFIQSIKMPQTNIEELLHFLSITILVFLNQGTTSLSNAFTEEPYSWGLTIPISLYFKFALELHAHLGLCVGVGFPSLLYWGLTRKPLDWYLDAILDFNIEFLKTAIFNLVIGIAHWLVMKIIHHFHEKMKENKKLSGWKMLAMLESTMLLYHPMLRPIDAKDMFLKLLELLSVFFYNGNVMLLSWGFSGLQYNPEVGKAITWVSLGSALFVWMKDCLKLLEMPPASDEKPCKEGKDQTLDPSVEAKDQAPSLPEC